MGLTDAGERARRWSAALAGALGFLSRLPVGREERHWAAFRRTPTAFPVAGYLVGAGLAVPLAVDLPSPTAAVAFAAWAYAVTGINHVDGLADLGDALAVHGSPGERRSVMTDTAVGVGALVAVGLVIAGLALAGLALAGLGRGALAVVVAAEVGAKVGTAAVVCLGSAAHEGLGSQLTGRAGPASLALPALVALPAAALAWPRPAGAVALLAGLATALAVLAWARRRLGGVSGDVMGAANELARVVALHAGVIAWTPS